MPQVFKIGSYWVYFWANNSSKIPSVILNRIMRIIEARSAEIIFKWTEYFHSISFYC